MNAAFALVGDYREAVIAHRAIPRAHSMLMLCRAGV
jgi:hypothetical protein